MRALASQHVRRRCAGKGVRRLRVQWVPPLDAFIVTIARLLLGTSGVASGGEPQAPETLRRVRLGVRLDCPVRRNSRRMLGLGHPES